MDESDLARVSALEIVVGRNSIAERTRDLESWTQRPFSILREGRERQEIEVCVLEEGIRDKILRRCSLALFVLSIDVSKG